MLYGVSDSHLVAVSVVNNTCRRVESVVMSLLQQKKEQWAREREEMSQLYYPWGTDEKQNRHQTLYSSSFELSKSNKQLDYQDPSHRHRSPSLPPIHNFDIYTDNESSLKRFAFYDEEGDTSGYASENPNQFRSSNRYISADWHNNNENRLAPEYVPEDKWTNRTPLSNTGEEGRPRWGDRGVATGRLWEPTAAHARLPQMKNQGKGTPSWVERGLNMIESNAEVLVIDQKSSTNSGFDCDRSSCNGSDEGRTFLRGQNIPLEPEVKAQRENQRLKALELQLAIKNQLEDQERRRREEREQLLQEEKMEEIRLQRQQEQERIRMEEEKRRNHEKQRIEELKQESLKKAIEDAQYKAKIEKERRFTKLKVDDPDNLQISLNDNIGNEIRQSMNPSPTLSNQTFDFREENKINNVAHQSMHSSKSIAHESLNSFAQLSITDSSRYSIIPLGINGDIFKSQSNIQLALLIPQNMDNNIHSMSLGNLSNITTNAKEFERLLTPKKYRSLRNRNVHTQTDTSLYNISMFEDKASKDNDDSGPLDSHSSTLTKEKRFRSEERYKSNIENRPKWGVNRPIAQYKKQSEKDPFYTQKRKLRYKHRSQPRPYVSHSSDDSRSPSPSTRSDLKHRDSLSQSYWRNKRSSQDLPIDKEDENLLSDKQIEERPIAKMSPSKRLTLSQKFINDKYGNKKMWFDESPDKVKTSDKEKTSNDLNKSKRDNYQNDIDVI